MVKCGGGTEAQLRVLAESEERLKAIIASASDAIITIDEDHRVVLFNATAERIFRCSASAILGQPLDRFLPGSVRERHDDYIRMFAEAGAKRATGGERALTALRADGEPFPIEAQISSATVGGKRFFTLVIRDVTDRKRAEAQQESLLRREREARLAAETASRAKDEFLSVVSHELRNPLTSMLNWLRVLRRTEDPKQVVQAIESMERVVHAQAKLIDDLLDVSRVVTGHQVVWNLLLNAGKFTPPGGLVEIRLETVNGWAHVIVRDTGRGISAEFLPQVFEPFQQADLTATGGHGGLGLGLAIVRHLVELHGGTVEVESAGEGHGATFTVMLPRLGERSHGKLTTDRISKPL